MNDEVEGFRVVCAERVVVAVASRVPPLRNKPSLTEAPTMLPAPISSTPLLERMSELL